MVKSISNLIECGVDASTLSLLNIIYYTNNLEIVSLLKITKYMLGKGVKIVPRMQDYIEQIGIRFEYYKDSIDKNIVEDCSKALDELYKIFEVEPVPHRIIHDGESDIKVSSKEWKKQFKELWDYLVPSKGRAKTVQGELIRIIGIVTIEILDNGAINWNSDFKQMIKDMIKYLKLNKGLDDNLVNEAIDIAKKINPESTKKELYRLSELIVNWIIYNPKPLKI